MSEGPFEPDEGQESEPPNLALALLVSVVLLEDLRDFVEEHTRHHDDPLVLRVAAVVAVLHRIREGLNNAGNT
jgi:hypothetical protein